MMKQPLTILFFLALWGSTLAVAETPGQLLEAQPGDLVSATLDSAQPRAFNLNRSTRPAQACWPLDASRPLSDALQPHVAESRHYVLEVSARELSLGVKLPTTAPGALVRVHPQRSDASQSEEWNEALDPMNLVLVAPDNRAFEHGTGMDLLVSAEQLETAGNPFPEGTHVFRIAKELKEGVFYLFADQLPDSNVSILIHVLEKESVHVMSVQCEQAAAVAGQTVGVRVLPLKGRGTWTVDRISGHVLSPDGDRYPLEFQIQRDGSLTANLRTRWRAARKPGLYEVVVQSVGHEGRLEIHRMARTAFALTQPTARLTGEMGVQSSPRQDTLLVTFGLEVAVAGRYEVRAVLTGSDKESQPRPIAVSHSASWLEPGTGRLTLEMPAEIIRASELNAPYELHNLQLIDQSQMGVLHHQARAARLSL